VSALEAENGTGARGGGQREVVGEGEGHAVVEDGGLLIEDLGDVLGVPEPEDGAAAELPGTQRQELNPLCG
jgi:hypothetical protein